MSKTIVNLTMPIVVKEIEEILETYPHHPYQQAFAHPDWQQTLLAYVLSRVTNVYAVVEEDAKSGFISTDSVSKWMIKTLELEKIIRQGIEKIMSEEAESINRQIPAVVESACGPSHWFG